mgnify:CR=1 FL=1
MDFGEFPGNGCFALRTQEFGKLFKGNISESVVIDLEVSGGSSEPEQKVIVKDYQLNPVTDEVVHLDFYKVDLSQKLQTVVPVMTTGTSKGERMGGMRRCWRCTGRCSG